MDELRKVALVSVGRACGFAGLAIFCVLAGLSYQPLLAARTGGILMTLMTLVLLYKSHRALTQDYRRTELWMMLDRDFRPPTAYAQWAASTVLRDTYLRFAQYSAAVAVVTWLIALVLSLAGVE